MFTGIVETVGKVLAIRKEDTNIHFQIESEFANELKIDQSVAHNGVCLTVTECDNDSHWVTAIDETLNKTNLGDWKEGDQINLERCMQMNGRLDGHIVQGHVDQIAECIGIENQEGSWVFTFRYKNLQHVTVEKGSICVNGVSLTVVNSREDRFSVAIIPYTYEHTNFNAFEIGTKINLEFDIIGKYIAKLMAGR